MEILCFMGVDIRDADGNAVPVDYILGKVPSVGCVVYISNSEVYSNQSFQKLNSIKLFNKLFHFRMDIRQTSEELDPEIIGKFLENNMLSGGEAQLSFFPDAPEIELMKVKFQQIEENWTPPFAAPSLIVEVLND